MQINSALTGNTPSSITVISLTPGSVVVNTAVVYLNSASSSSSLTTSIQSSLKVAAASSTTFPVNVDSIAVSGQFVFINFLFCFIFNSDSSKDITEKHFKIFKTPKIKFYTVSFNADLSIQTKKRKNTFLIKFWTIGTKCVSFFEKIKIF